MKLLYPTMRTLLLLTAIATCTLYFTHVSEAASTTSPKQAHRSALISAGDVNSVWSGAVTATSAVVKAKMNSNFTTSRLVYSQNSSLSNPIYTSYITTTPLEDRIATFNLSNLYPNTTYYYNVEVNGVLDTVRPGKFMTGSNVPTTVRFASISDIATGSNHVAYDVVRSRNPRFLMHLGDMFYADVAVNDRDQFRAAFDTLFASSRPDALYRSMWTTYVWDDHDFGPDNSDTTSASRPAARLTYQERVPHFPLPALATNAPADAAIYQAFSVGRVYFIMTDLRSARSTPGLTNNASRTMMGAEQKAWFKQQLINANGQYPIIIWGSSVPWVAPAANYGDDWGGFNAERVEIANFIRDNNIKGMHIVAGDAHMLALDDGTNSDYATGGGAPIPVMHAAALGQGGSIKGGPYSHGYFRGSSQYGLFDITDNGGDQVCLRFRGVYYNSTTNSNSNKIDWQNCVSAEPIFDYGNLPPSFTASTLAENGARHVKGDWYLGTNATVDSGPGNPYMPPNDNDGAQFLTSILPGQTATLQIIARNPSNSAAIARLGVWIDWNGNGSFDASNEFSSHTVPVGTSNVSINVPASYNIAVPRVMRVRLFDPLHIPGNALDASDFRGAVYSGEVEDYYLLDPTAVSTTVVAIEQPASAEITLVLFAALSLLTLRLLSAEKKQAKRAATNASRVASKQPPH